MTCDRASYNCPLHSLYLDWKQEHRTRAIISSHCCLLKPHRGVLATCLAPLSSPYAEQTLKSQVCSLHIFAIPGPVFSGPWPCSSSSCLHTHTPFLRLRSSCILHPIGEALFFSFKHLDINYPNLQGMNLLVCGAAAPGPQDGELMVEEAHKGTPCVERPQPCP